MAYYRKKGKVYELRVYYNKKVHSRTFHPPEDITPGELAYLLEQELDEFKKDIGKERRITSYSTFKETAEYWMNTVAQYRLSPTTYHRYQILLNRVYDSSIGNTKLRDINQQQLNSFYNDLLKPGSNKHTAGALSQKTVREHHNIISRVLNAAWRMGAIKENIAQKADPPIAHRKEIEFLTEDEVKNVLQLLQYEPTKYKAMITLLLLLGCRRGELCGLEWKDIDFKKGTVHIQRTSLYINHEIITKEPKTFRGNRIISLDCYSAEVLKEHKNYQLEEKLKAGKFWQEYDRVFTQEDGSPIHPTTISCWWRKFQEKNDLGHHSLHSLRHTNASMLIAFNTNVATVSGRLGHADASTTLMIYTHQFKTRDEEAATLIGEFANEAVKGIKDNKVINFKDYVE